MHQETKPPGSYCSLRTKCWTDNRTAGCLGSMKKNQARKKKNMAAQRRKKMKYEAFASQVRPAGL